MISFEIKAAWVKKHLERNSWGFLFGLVFWRWWAYHNFWGINTKVKWILGIAYMKKLILTPVTKNFEVWTNLWMLATLASQIPILSFGFASAWIGIFLIHSLRSFIRKILSISSQFFVTGVKNWYNLVFLAILWLLGAIPWAFGSIPWASGPIPCAFWAIT